MTDPVAERPYMPGYGLEAAERPPGEELPWTRVTELLESTRNYWVSTVRPDGRPHAMPVWGVWLDGAFWFSTGKHTRKARNLAGNPSCSIHISGAEEAVIVEGEATAVTDAGLQDRFVDACEPKYNWRFPKEFFNDSALYAVRPRVAFSFNEMLGDSATRWRFA